MSASSATSGSVTCFAPAKINLALHVTGQRADGYHALESLVVFANIGDVVSCQIADEDEGAGDRLEMDGPFAAALDDHANNLILKAAEIFRTKRGEANLPPLAFHLRKNLPVASGIGGGSADAAAALLCLERLADVDHGIDLSAIAPKLGADVPMCLASSSLIATGLGEEIRQVEPFPTLHMVLANPLIPVSTPQVFAALSSRHNDPLAALPRMLTTDDVAAWLKEQRNDLQSAAITLVPAIGQCLEALSSSGAMFSRMSGSGATCFGLYESREAAQTAATMLQAAQPDWWVVAVESGEFGADRAIKTEGMPA